MVQWHIRRPNIQQLQVQLLASTDRCMISYVESPAIQLSEYVSYVVGDWPSASHGHMHWRASHGLSIFFIYYFYCNIWTFISNHQPEPWCLWQNFETGLAPLPANDGVLERPRPHGSNQPGGAISIGHLNWRNDYLVNSMYWRHHRQRLWLDTLKTNILWNALASASPQFCLWIHSHRKHVFEAPLKYSTATAKAVSANHLDGVLLLDRSWLVMAL